MKQNFLSTTTHNIAWLHKRYLANELQLKPPFQRNPVWTDKQKSYLIDTILRGYPIPEIYIQEFTDAKGNDMYVLVDGQQRIRACVDFIQGRFTLDPKDTPDWADMGFDDLSEDDKKKIFNYNFVVRTLPEMPDQELRSMFQRLNRNVVALNNQELRHATYWGEFISCIEAIAEDERWSMIGIFTSNDIRRMLDVEFISEIIVGYLHGVQNKKASLDDWYEAYEKEFDRKSDVQTTVNIVLGEILVLLPGVAETRWKKKSDFYTLFLVLADDKKRLPFSKNDRDKYRSKLVEFGAEVDAFLSGSDRTPGPVADYAFSVERAASDLAKRQERHDIVRKLLS